MRDDCLVCQGYYCPIYPPLQAFVNEEIGSHAAAGLNNGPFPRPVKELPDIVIAVISRLYICVHIETGLKAQWKNAALPTLLAGGTADSESQETKEVKLSLIRPNQERTLFSLDIHQIILYRFSQ